jgi:argininosuccinate synthase
VVAPWREWDLMSRQKLLEFADTHGIPISMDKRGEAPFSVDANLLHTSSEGKVGGIGILAFIYNFFTGKNWKVHMQIFLKIQEN